MTAEPMELVTVVVSSIAAGMLYAGAAVAIAALVLAVRATSAGAGLPTWRLAMTTLFSGRRQRTSPPAPHPHLNTARRAVMWVLVAAFLTVAWGLQAPGPRVCACGLTVPNGYYTD